MKKRLIAILLVIVMVMSLLPISVLAETLNDESTESDFEMANQMALLQENLDEGAIESADPQQVIQTIMFISYGLAQFGVSDDKITAFAGFLGGIGASSMIAGGVVGILQMVGLITDPMGDALTSINSTLTEQNKALDEISGKIDDIALTLKKMQAEQKLKDRANKAHEFTAYWDNYYEHFLLPMKAYMNNYESWIRDYTKDWSQGEIERGDLYVYYTMKDDKKTQTYAKEGRLDLNKSDSGEVIETKYTVCLPEKYVDDAMQGHIWKADDKPDVIINKLAGAVINAMNDGQLGCSQWFKDKWNAETDHTATAKEVASGLYNNMIYIGSCSVVNNVEAGYRDQMREMVTLMNGSWKLTLSTTGGLAALIVPIQNTYAFEGDAKKDLLNSIYGLSELLTQYSVFAISVASQMDVLTTAEKTEVRQNWLNGITGTLKDGKYSGGIENIKKSTIKNKDNYCYITNTLINLRNYYVESEADIKIYQRKTGLFWYLTIEEYDATKWVWKNRDTGTLTNMVNIADYPALDVMYKTWQATGSQGGSFDKYFIKNQVAKNRDETFWFRKRNSLLTSYTIRANYPKTQPIWMECSYDKPWESTDSDPNYFKLGNYYNIMDNKGWMDNTINNDQIIADIYATTGSGTLQPKTQLATRAFYLEHKRAWFVDEPWVFTTSWVNKKTIDAGDERKNYHYTFRLDGKWSTYLGGAVCALQVSALNDTESGIIPEGQFDPDAIVSEMASGTTTTIDTTYQAHQSEKIIDAEDWRKLDVNYLFLFTSNQKFDETVEQSVEQSLYLEKEAGKDINLSDSEKKALINQVKATYKAAEDETLSNQNMNETVYLDPLGIYGNLEVTEKLAKAVLPDAEIATDGQTMDPVENMITAAIYEPYVHLTWKQTGNGYEPKLETTYYVSPKLLVWCDSAGSYNMYDISDEAMQALGLSMKVRLSTANAQNNESAKITVYDDSEMMNIVDNLTASVQDSGNNAYVEFNVSKSGLFSVNYVNKPSVNTGIDNQNMQVYFALMILGIGLIVMVAVILKKRRRIAENK